MQRTTWHMVNLHTAGLILLAVGILGAVLDLVLWEPWGPAFLRRRAVHTDRSYRRLWPRPTTRIVDEEEHTRPPGP